MSATYTAYPDLNTPNEVITKMRDFVASKGYEIIQDLTDDLDIFDGTVTDGKKFTFLDKSQTYFINMRSQNGINIFGLNDEIEQETINKSINTDKYLNGVGMTVSESWSDEVRWYNQYNVPLKFAQDPNTVRDVLGAYMPVPTGTEDIEPVEEPEPVPEPVPVEEPEPPEYPIPPTPPPEPSKDKYPDEPVAPKVRAFLYNFDNSGPGYYGTKVDGGGTSKRLSSGQIGVDSSGDNEEQRTARIVYDNDILNYYQSVLPNYVLVIPFAVPRWNSYSGTIYDSYDSLNQITRWNAGYDMHGEPNPNSQQPRRDQLKYLLPTASELGNIHEENGIPVSSNAGGVLPLTLNGDTGNRDIHMYWIVGTSEGWGARAKSFVAQHRPSQSSVSIELLKNKLIGYYDGYLQSNGAYVTPMQYAPLMLMRKDDFNYLLNYYALLEAYNNRTSTEWQNYQNQIDAIDSAYASAMSAYNSAYASYQVAKEAYDAEVASIKAAYQALLDAYNAYLVAQALYDQYLVLLAEYNEYLRILEEAKNRYTLFCNEVLDPTNEYISTITFSLLKTNDTYYQVSHLIVGNLIKYDNWEGGIIFSGSANRYNMIPANYLYKHDKTSDRAIYPILGSGKVSNTYLRIDIDNAPKDTRGRILWASSGEDNITGKRLSMPIRTGNGVVPNGDLGVDGALWTISTGDGNTEFGNGDVPHYYFMQSHERLDSGRNVNTLNCITINMPIFAAVLIDPDELDNYAAAGEVLGVYFISMYNIQTSSVYEINYPASNDTCQAFSVGKRRGVYGFDGISIKQMDTPLGGGETPTSGSSGDDDNNENTEDNQSSDNVEPSAGD